MIDRHKCVRLAMWLQVHASDPEGGRGCAGGLRHTPQEAHSTGQSALVMLIIA
jgi:hypothetical protein